MATDKTHFRTSLSGFNKADVLEYLDKQNADFLEESRRSAAALEEKSKKIEELSAAADKLTAELSDAKSQAEEAKAKAEELAAALEDAKRALSESEAVIASQTELIDSLKKEAEAHEADGTGKDAETERKAELYDGMSSQLGDILITANKSADEIIDAANKKAEAINAEAVRSAEESRNAFAVAMDEFSRMFRERADAVSNGCCDDINEEFGRIREAVDRALLQLQKSSLCIAEKTEQSKASLDAELKASLGVLDAKITEIKNK